MFKVIFPQLLDQRYYNIHFTYVLNIFKELDCDILFESLDSFVVTINKRSFLMDYADSTEVVKANIPVFKFHCVEETDNVFCFPPVSFYNWKQYELLRSWVKYKAVGALSCRQRVYGNARERRSSLRRLLRGRYPDIRMEQVGQLKYLQEVESTFLAVFCPGWCNNMLDRAQFQYMGLGCCTVSPKLPERLPFGKLLLPGVHYVCCKDDYSDVVDLIEYYRSRAGECIEIGNNAKALFQETAIPRRIGKWIKTKL